MPRKPRRQSHEAHPRQKVLTVMSCEDSVSLDTHEELPMKHQFQLRLAVYPAVVLVGIMLALTVDVRSVLALATPVRCDSPFSKYGCTQVIYTISGGQAQITDRNWQGAIDGGAKQWQMYWIKDFEYVNNAWVWRETWGQSGWRTDVNMSPWFNWANDNRTRGTSSVTVQFKHRYQETANGSTYYWCSSIYEHYLWNNTSAEVGTGVCSS